VCKCGEKTVCELVQNIEGVCHIPHVLRPHRSAAARHPGMSAAVKARGAKHSRRLSCITACRKIEMITKRASSVRGRVSA
jgi:hypothetical protein